MFASESLVLIYYVMTTLMLLPKLMVKFLSCKLLVATPPSIATDSAKRNVSRLHILAGIIFFHILRVNLGMFGERDCAHFR